VVQTATAREQPIRAAPVRKRFFAEREPEFFAEREPELRASARAAATM
jgi:hypothetical protein